MYRVNSIPDMLLEEFNMPKKLSRGVLYMWINKYSKITKENENASE